MSIDDFRDHAEVKCGPTHHLACDCREAAVAKLVEALKFYADPYNYIHEQPADGPEYPSEVERKGHSVARAALDEFYGRKV